MSNNTDVDAWVTEDDFKKSSTEVCQEKASFLLQNLPITCKHPHIPCPVVAVCCQFESMSSKHPDAASISPSLSVNFEVIMVLFLGPDSGSSDSSMVLCFQISTRWSRVNS
jgi:hypothetical protein